MAVNLMQLFWDLSTTDDEQRISSAGKMIEALYGTKNESSSYCDSNELQYCLQRLVKGLASNRTGVRHGYFITLVELLKVFPVPLEEFFKILKDNLEHVGNVKAQEERGIYFGRVFAYLAIVESGKLNKPTDIEHIVKGLVKVHEKKSYLQEFCASVINRLIVEIENELVIYQNVLPYIGIDSSWDKCCPGKLYILLSLLDRFPDSKQISQQLPMDLKSTDSSCVCLNDMKSLAEVLMVSSNSHPRIHIIWPLIISKFRNGKLWKMFWNTTVNETLLISSHERKYLCYKLIEEYLLPSLTLEEVDIVFSHRLIQQLENNGATKHHLLHNVAKHFLDNFPAVITDSSPHCGVRLTLAMHLTRHKTGNVFDSAIKHLLTKVTVDDMIYYIKYLVNDLWIETEKKHKWMNHELTLLLKFTSSSLKRNRFWLVVLAQFLLLQTHFTVLSPIPSLRVPNVSRSPSVNERTLYTSKLQNVMTLLSDLKCVRGQSLENDLSCDLWPVALVLYIEDVRKHTDCVQFITEINEEVWEKAIEIVIELNDKEAQRHDIDNVFLYLTSVCLLNMLQHGDRGVDNVEEIIECHKRRLASAKKTPRRRKSMAPSLDWLTVLVDLLLGLLSKHDQFWRNVSERAFLWLKELLTLDAIQVIVKAIQPQSVEDIMKPEDEEGVVTHKTDNTDNGSCDMDSTSNSASNSASKASEDENGGHIFTDVGAEFRANVKHALGDLAAIDSDQESVLSLGDEEMETLDSALSSVFLKQKERNLAKKHKKTDKIAVMHFKMRILELVGLYIRHQSTNPLMLEFLEPLLALVLKYNSHKTYSPLSEKSRSVIDKLCRVKSYPRDGFDMERLHLILKDLITKKLYSAQRTSAIVTQCCMFLMRVLKGANKMSFASPMATRSARKRRNIEKEKEEENPPSFGSLMIKDVISWCSVALNDMIIDKNCNVQVGFFEVLSERQPEIAWRLFPSLIASFHNPGNHFRKVQGLRVLQAFLGNYRQLSEQTVVNILSPVTVDLLTTLSEDILSIPDDSKAARHIAVIEGFCDTVTIVQSYDETMLNVKVLSQVLQRLSLFDDRKLINCITALSSCIDAQHSSSSM